MDAIDTRLAHFARNAFGHFTAGHAALVGFSANQRAYRLDAGLWESQYEDVYRLAGVPPTWRGDILAACWAGGFRAVASHRSAAALWRLAGGRRHIEEITCPRWRRARHDGVLVHETSALDPCDVTMVDGIPVTTPERTLLGMAEVCSPSLLEMAEDGAERRGLVTPGSIRAMLVRLARPGRGGVRALRDLIDARSPERATPESEKETQLVQAFRAFGLPELVTQHEVRQGGRLVGRVDAAYPQARIAIEYDSDEFHGGRLALVRDSERRSRLLAAGWHPFTATDAELRAGCRTLCPAVADVLRRAS